MLFAFEKPMKDDENERPRWADIEEEEKADEELQTADEEQEATDEQKKLIITAADANGPQWQKMMRLTRTLRQSAREKDVKGVKLLPKAKKAREKRHLVAMRCRNEFVKSSGWHHCYAMYVAFIRVSAEDSED